MARKRFLTDDNGPTVWVDTDLTDLALLLPAADAADSASTLIEDGVAGAGQFSVEKLTPLSDDNLSEIAASLPPRSDPQSSEFTEAPAGSEAAAPGDHFLAGTIAGITFDENGSNNAGSLSIPPDPHGAVGPNHIVSVVNTSLEWHTKAGAQQNSQSLKSFFSSTTNTFDPKVIYDQHSGRFVIVTLEQQGRGDASAANDVSRIYVAVSDDSDPNGVWHRTTINAVTNIGGNNTWADYPGIAVDNQAIYITNNMFRHSNDQPEGQRLWIINKGQGTGGFYDGGGAGVTVHNPATASGDAYIATTIQPAHVFGDVPGAAGTFLVSYGGISNGTNEFLQVTRVDNALGTPTFTNRYVALGNIENTGVGLTDAPQSGTATRIETNDRRALNSVWRDNQLYVAATINGTGTDNNQATAFWAQVNTTNLAALSLAQSGTIGGEAIAPGTFTFFPSIAVAADGDVGVGFSASAPSIFGGSYFAYRDSADPLGTMRAPITVQAGQDFYVRTFTGTANRWGDYSATVIDPSDNATFWTFNEYAMSRGTITNGTQDGRWATVWGQFGVEAAATAGSVTINDVSTTEGNAGTQVLAFTVTRTGGTAAFSVNYATANGSAAAGSDYVAISGTLSFGGGVNTQTVSVTINGDTAVEPSETLFVNLSGATNGAAISDGQGVGTIINDDNSPPVITSDGGGATATVSRLENATIVTTVVATDADLTAPTYSIIGGADAARFGIHPTSGLLRFLAAPNFEAPTDSDGNNSYIVQVRASDGSLFDTQTITVNIIDLNEVPNDFDGAGQSDVLWRNDNGAIALWQMQDGQIAVERGVGAGPSGYLPAATGDFDGDGTADVFWRHSSGAVALWEMQAGQVQVERGIGSGPDGYQVAETGDFNGDGTADVLWRDGSGDVALWEMQAGQVQVERGIGSGPAGYQFADTGDFNGDGTADVLWRDGSGAIALWEMQGGHLQVERGIGTGPAGYQFADTGDFTGDGTADVLWRHSSGTIALWEMQAGQVQVEREIGSGPAGFQVADTGDFNGDGTADVLWRDGSGNVALWEMQAGHVAIERGVGVFDNTWHLV